MKPIIVCKLILMMALTKGATPELKQDAHGTNCFLLKSNETVSRALCLAKDIRRIQFLLTNEIEDLRVVKTPTRNIGYNAFRKLTNLRILNLRNNKIEYASSRAFKNLANVTELDLSMNRIRLIHPLTFVFMPKLRKLTLSANFIIKFKYVAASISMLSHLEELDMDNNKLIEFIHEADMEPLKTATLRVLKLRYCLLRYVHSNAFTSLRHSLEELYIDGNYLNAEPVINNITNGLKNSSIKIFSAGSTRLKDIPISVLMNLQETNLKMLILSFNVFTPSIVANELSPRLEHLETLELQYCNMIGLILDADQNFPNLKHAYLEGNSFLKMPRSISSMTKLRTLQVSNQRVSIQAQFVIPKRIFLNLQNLGFLYMHKNRIPHVTNETFAGLSALEILDMTSCSTTFIAENAFQELISLKKLFLSGNNFLLQDGTFHGLRNLEKLTLTSSITSRAERINPFRHTLKLVIINLSGNELTNYDLEMLEPLRNLQLLMVSNNKITSWKNRLDILNQNKNLTFLSIHNNDIKLMTDAMMADLSNVENLMLTPNRFDCDLCETLAFQNWMKKIQRNQTDVTLVFEHDYKGVNCSRPESLAGKEIINLKLSREHCIEKRTELWSRLTATGSACFLIGILLAWLIHFFRWYIRYWLFWISLRVKRYQESKDTRE